MTEESQNKCQIFSLFWYFSLGWSVHQTRRFVNLPGSPHWSNHWSDPSAHMRILPLDHTIVPCSSSCFSQQRELQSHLLESGVSRPLLSSSSRRRGKFMKTFGFSVVSQLPCNAIDLSEYSLSKVPGAIVVSLLFSNHRNSIDLRWSKAPSPIWAIWFESRPRVWRLLSPTKIPCSKAGSLLSFSLSSPKDSIPIKAPTWMSATSFLFNQNIVHWDRWLKTPAPRKVMWFPSNSTLRASAGISCGTWARPQNVL